VVEQHL